VGLFRGFLAPFRGGAFIVRHRLWAYLVLPVLLDLALGVTTMILALRYWRGEQWVGEQLIKAPAIGWFVLAVLTVVSGVILFLVAQPLVSALFSDRLSERIERQVRGEAPAAPFFASAGRAVAHGLLKVVLYALAMLAAFALSIWTAGIGAIAGLALAGLFIAYDGFDYPLSRRGASFGKKWAYLARHPAQTIGFGAGATLLYLIPFALFVAPPFVAAGATLAFMEAEKGTDKATEKATERTTGNSAASSSARAEAAPGGDQKVDAQAKKPAEM
jgi:CysZ protein